MKVLALIIGIALLAIGVAGFVPQLTQDGMLFGVMPMDQLRCILFIVTGAFGIFIGLSRRRAPLVTNGTAGDMRDWR